MVQEPKTGAASPSELLQHPPKKWLNRTRTFFDVPNPKVVKIFLISIFATFSSGIAFVFEWIFHGRNHAGFQWIIYYGLSLIFLPVLILLSLGIVIAVTTRHESKQVVSSVVEEEEHHVDHSAGKGGNEVNDYDKNCQSLAVVINEYDKKCNEKTLEHKISKLERAVSFPLRSQVRSCRTR
ncbi:Transmembrane protein [Hirschfeldia incana]|nr:Transmembrane protein [Hirschfeldia incana]